MMLLAPVYWLTGSLAITYNIWLTVGLSLNGLLSFLFLRSLKVSTFLSGCGGMAIVMLPAVCRELDAVQITHIWPQIWTLLAYRRLLQAPSELRGVETGFAFGMCFMISVHQGFLFTMILAIVGAIPLCFHRRPGWLAAITVGLIVAVAMIAPLAIPMRGHLDKQSFVRSPESVSRNSAVPGDYLRFPRGVMEEENPARGRSLSAGVTKHCLMVIAVVALRRPRKRPWTLVLILIAAASFALSLGPHLSVSGIQPWSILYDILPWVQKIRSPIRFVIYAHMTIVFLAMIGLHEMLVQFGRTPGREARRFGMLACVGVAMLESRPPSIPTVTVADDRVPVAWANTLNHVSQPGDGLLCLPMTSGPSVRSLEVEARWVLTATQHHCHLVNRYSGFFPEHYVKFAADVAARGVTQDALDQLRRDGVRWIAIDRGWQWRTGLLTLLGNPEPVGTEDRHVDLYRLSVEIVPVAAK